MLISSSPHITQNSSVRKIMIDVIIALIPASLAGVWLFGFFALYNIFVCVASCLVFEYLFCVLRDKPSTLSDFSAVVTGLILALNLPPASPVYVPVLGSLFAIVIVKMLFGGLGKNFANPAASARVFLLLAFSSVMTKYFIAPINYAGGESFFNFELFKLLPANVAENVVDGFTSATPLRTGASLSDLFLGNVSGSIGETSVLALLLGGSYLCIRRVIDWKIPFTLLFSVSFFCFLFTSGSLYEKLSAIPFMLFSGGIMLGAIFMATDYSSSPNGRTAQLIYAAIIGFFAVFLRVFSAMPEGMSYAILLGNVCAPLLDKIEN